MITEEEEDVHKPASELSSHLCFTCVCLPAAPKSAVLEEMLHNLDFCDILVLGGDLDPRQECLELNHSELHQRHLDATNSTAGYSIYGEAMLSPPPGVTLSEWGVQGVTSVMAALSLVGRGDRREPLTSRLGLLAPPLVSHFSILRPWRLFHSWGNL